MTTDPAPFLSTIVATSAAFVAIVGGLLVARFVTMDSDQRTSRKVLADARERLEAARGRMSTAWEAVLDWDADDFFSSGRVARFIGDDTFGPRDLMRMKDWEHSEDDLRPYIVEAIREHRAAREILPPLVTRYGEDWDDFRRRTAGLPPIRWPRLWEHVYNQIALERSAEAKARERAARGSSPMAFHMDSVLTSISATSDTARMVRGITSSDAQATAARRRDGLVAAHDIARQQVQDFEAELRRLQAEHAEIVRPDARLWWGVAIVVLFAAAGVALPLWIMAQGPKDLASVRWLFWVFGAALAALLAYIVVYLAQVSRAKPPSQ